MAQKGVTSRPDLRGGRHNGKPGTAPFVPTPAERALVRTLAGYGLRQADIAKVIRHEVDRLKGIDPTTLRRHFREELDDGSQVMIATAAQTLVGMITGKTTSERTRLIATLFFLKTRAGWKEARDFGPDSAPPETTEEQVDYSNLSTGELRQLKVLMTKAKSRKETGPKPPPKVHDSDDVDPGDET